MPGVTVRSAVQSAPDHGTAVHTDVAGFLGLAERGMTQRAVPLHGFEEYRNYFGGHVRGAYLSHAVQGFFANGGRKCWVVRLATRASWSDPAGRSEQTVEIDGVVAREDIMPPGTTGFDPETAASKLTGRRRMLLTALSPGPWGRCIEFDLQQLDVDLFSFVLSCPGSQTEVREGVGILDLVTSINEHFDRSIRFDPSESDRPVGTSRFYRRMQPRTDSEDLASPSNIAGARLQLLLPVPRVTAERNYSRTDPSDVDIVVTINRYRAWFADVRIGWAHRESDAEPLTLVLAYVRPDTVAWDWVFISGSDCVEIVDSINARLAYGLGGLRPNVREEGEKNREARRMSPEVMAGLEVCKQRKTSREASTSGVTLEELLGASAIRTGEALKPLCDRVEWTCQQGSPFLERLQDKDMFGTNGTEQDAKRGLQLFEEIEEIGMVAFPDLSQTYCLEPEYRKIHAVEPPPDAAPCHDSPLSHTLYRRRVQRQPDVGALNGIPHVRDERPEDFFEKAQRELIRHCESRQDRVALLDMPPDHLINDPAQWRRTFDSTRAALYYPWLLVEDPYGGPPVRIPPCGHVAGIYAKVENTIGPHQSPANIALVGCLDVARHLSDRNHAELNDLSINVIRSQPGRGLRILGARTLAKPGTLEKKGAAMAYVAVRRLLNWIVVALERKLAWTVFEPNDTRLQEEVERSVRSFLLQAWRRGMLAGARPEDAFHALCDPSNNPEWLTDSGHLVCEIGIRPPYPAEYLVVTLARQNDRFTLVGERSFRDG